jgi:hypothetical protein
MGPVDDPLKFPMRVGDFLALPEQRIRRGDIVLSRSPTWSSWLIRKATGGFFSYAALVFLVPHVEEGFNNAFLLESTSAGVGLANLKSYVSGRRPHSAVAVLRLEGQDFNDEFFKSVRGLMLDFVQVRYDYGRVLRMGISMWFNVRLAFYRARNGKKNSMRDAVQATHRSYRNWVPPQFICSGFVQYGFVEALRRMGRHPSAALFRDGLSTGRRDEMLAVTPEDIATSSKLTWRYVMRSGWVYPVSNYAEARKIISGG